MQSLTRVGILFAIAGLMACGGGGSAGGGSSSGGGSASGGGSGGMTCFEDSECPNQQLFSCNTTTSKCEASCRNKADCTAAVRGEYALDYCGGTLGCECDEGRCVAGLCSADSQCGSQVCRDGKCVEAPAPTTVGSCSITPDLTVLKEGAKTKFWVSTWDAAMKPVVVKGSDVTWSAVAASVTLSGEAKALSAEFTGAAANTAAESAVQASVGGKTCTAKVLVISKTVPASSIAAVVTDELSGRPIAGATVQLSNAATGVQLGTGTTDAKGYVAVSGLIAGKVTVTAYHTDFNYLTVANYEGSGTDANFLSFVLRRNQVDKYGGQRGTVNGVPMTSNVHAGLSGMSIAGSVTDLSFTQLLGPSRKTNIKIGTTVNVMDVPLPDGVFLGFGAEKIKDQMSAQGLAGVCVDGSGAPDEAKIAAGTCGTRAAWALVGDVPLGELPIEAITNTSNINYGQILSRLIPVFKKFNSSVIRDVSFTMKDTPRPNGVPDFSDVSHFTQVNHEFSRVALGYNFVARVPDLPKFKGTFVDGVLLLGGAGVAGRGVVPLGLGAAVNTTPVDNKTDTQSELSGPGLVTMRMAPTHSGIEGSDYGVIALALSLKSVTDASAGLATSAIFTRVPKNELSFDPKGTTPLDLSPGFLAMPENAKYNFTDSVQGGLAARTFKFTTDPGSTGVSAVRVVFTDATEKRWVVLTDTTTANAGFVMPKPPSATFRDRTFAGTSGARSTLIAQFVRATENGLPTGPAATFAKIVEFDGFQADRLTDFTTGFSIIDYGAPDIDWVTPAMNNATIAKGSEIVVKVSDFKVGATASDDGFVRVTFTGGTGCTDIEQKTDASMGKGEIRLTLPAACAGAGVKMTALLIGANNMAVAPPVSSEITATIQ